MAEFASSLPSNVYGISLGDIVWNKPEYFDTYAKEMRNIPVPVFSVIGNHDHNEGIKTTPKVIRISAMPSARHTTPLISETATS